MAPIRHGRQACAEEVRRALAILSPDMVALEFPAALEGGVRQLCHALPEIKLLVWRDSDGRALMLPGDPCDPRIEAYRTADEFGLKIRLVDELSANANSEHHILPDDHAAGGLGLSEYAAYCAAALRGTAGEGENSRLRRIAARLQAAAREARVVLYVGDLASFPALSQLLKEELPAPEPEEPANFQLQPVDERDLGKVLHEIPYVVYLSENFRASHGPEERFPVLRAIQHSLQLAAETYLQEYDERVSPTEWCTLFQYAKNLARVRGMIRPRLIEIVTAAKGCVNDDYGAIAMQQVCAYPPNARRGDKLPGQEGRPLHTSHHFYTELDGEKHLCSHAYPFPKLSTEMFEFRRRPRPTQEERLRWQQSFAMATMFGGGICSWPPEDYFIEDFFRKIRKRAYQEISDNHSTTEEFSSSILDGLDLRETIRNHHKGKVYVRRDRVPPGKVGPVIVIWRDFPSDAPGLWRTALYAEHQNESDIAFYCKQLGEDMVGPGITRTEYFGLLSVYPARQIPDVWSSEAIGERWRTCGRTLIAAGIALSEERYIAVTAPHPPDAELRSFARHYGRALIYLPLATFSKSLLQRVRQCHILASKGVRDYAADYIPKW